MDFDIPEECNYLPRARLEFSGMFNYDAENAAQTIQPSSPSKYSGQVVKPSKQTTNLNPHQTNATTKGTSTFSKTVTKTTSNGTTTTVTKTISTPTGTTTTVTKTSTTRKAPITKAIEAPKVKEIKNVTEAPRLKGAPIPKGVPRPKGAPKVTSKVTSPPPQTTTEIKTIPGTNKRVICVYPKKGEILSKIPEEKWKNVKPGPREDPNVVRTTEEEMREFHRMTNEFRIKNKRPPLEFSMELSEIARPHNENMMARKTPVGHEGFSERAALVKKAKGVGENCAMYTGPREHLQTLMENLINSKLHRENMLKDFNTLGIAIGKNAENMWFVTQFFALL